MRANIFFYFVLMIVFVGNGCKTTGGPDVVAKPLYEAPSYDAKSAESARLDMSDYEDEETDAPSVASYTSRS